MKKAHPHMPNRSNYQYGKSIWSQPSLMRTNYMSLVFFNYSTSQNTNIKRKELDANDIKITLDVLSVANL